MSMRIGKNKNCKKCGHLFYHFHAGFVFNVLGRENFFVQVPPWSPLSILPPPSCLCCLLNWVKDAPHGGHSLRQKPMSVLLGQFLFERKTPIHFHSLSIHIKVPMFIWIFEKTSRNFNTLSINKKLSRNTVYLLTCFCPVFFINCTRLQ